MPFQDYSITVNVFNNAGTGHINVTFRGPNGFEETYGNNVTNVNGNVFWGIRDERENLLQNHSSYQIPVTYEQMMAAWTMVQTRIAGHDNNYGLGFQNCVDFVRDILREAGLGNDVAGFMSGIDAPVTRYAELTDWLVNNGAGSILGGIGQVIGNIGELGTEIIRAAQWAWNGVGDILSSAQGFLNSVTSMVGGLAAGIGESIRDFFDRLRNDDDSDGDLRDREDTGNLVIDDDEFMVSAAMSETGPWDKASSTPDQEWQGVAAVNHGIVDSPILADISLWQRVEEPDWMFG